MSQYKGHGKELSQTVKGVSKYLYRKKPIAFISLFFLYILAITTFISCPYGAAYFVEQANRIEEQWQAEVIHQGKLIAWSNSKEGQWWESLQLAQASQLSQGNIAAMAAMSGLELLEIEDIERNKTFIGQKRVDNKSLKVQLEGSFQGLLRFLQNTEKELYWQFQLETVKVDNGRLKIEGKVTKLLDN